MGKIIFVRHGETAKNVEDVMHVVGDAELLTSTGIDQMGKTAERLREYSPVKIFSSKEARSIHAAQLIANTLTIPTEVVGGIEERNWGELSGKSWAEVQKVLDPMNLEERYKYIPAGGESWEQFEKRLVAAVGLIRQQSKDGAVVVVTHSGAIRALIPYLLNVPREESFRYNFDNASLTVFNESDGVLTQELLNDTAHLGAK